MRFTYSFQFIREGDKVFRMFFIVIFSFVSNEFLHEFLNRLRVYERFQENNFFCEFHSWQNGSGSELSLKRKRIITNNGQTNDPVLSFGEGNFG